MTAIIKHYPNKSQKHMVLQAMKEVAQDEDAKALLVPESSLIEALRTPKLFPMGPTHLHVILVDSTHHTDVTPILKHSGLTVIHTNNPEFTLEHLAEATAHY